MNPRAKVLAFWGAQPRVGTSTLALWSARLQASPQPLSCALVSAGPLRGASPTPSPDARTFQQLAPYAGHLTRSTLEHFFDRSPEGLHLIPLDAPGRPPAGEDAFLRALEALRPFFELLIVDLPAPAGGPLPAALLEACGEVVVVASFEDSSLQALQRMEKVLLARHLSLKP
ncbi:MAG TPA: hypothetical protein VFR02_10055, partial [bacterium]|nr:hypothetical protein [bacterium]